MCAFFAIVRKNVDLLINLVKKKKEKERNPISKKKLIRFPLFVIVGSFVAEW